MTWSPCSTPSVDRLGDDLRPSRGRRQPAAELLGDGAWCSARGSRCGRAATVHVPAYCRSHPGSVPTVKQHLAAIWAPCDWFVVHQVLPVNPSASVRGPKHLVTKGATAVLTPAEARKLLDRIDTGTLVGLRARALLSVMVFSFAWVSAAVGMPRQDYFRPSMRGGCGLHGGRAGSGTTSRRTIGQGGGRGVRRRRGP